MRSVQHTGSERAKMVSTPPMVHVLHLAREIASVVDHAFRGRWCSPNHRAADEVQYSRIVVVVGLLRRGGGGYPVLDNVQIHCF